MAGRVTWEMLERTGRFFFDRREGGHMPAIIHERLREGSFYEDLNDPQIDLQEAAQRLELISKPHMLHT